MKKKDSFLSSVRRFRVSATLAAIVYLALGLVLIFAPNASRALLCAVIGIGVTAYGAFNILSFLLSRDQSGYTLELLIGICAAAFGVFSLLNPTFLLDFLFIVLGLIGIAGGVSGIKRALTLRSFGFDGWIIPMIASLVVLLLALSVVFMPGLYGNMMMMVAGLMLAAQSVCDLVSLYRLSRFTRGL